MAPPIFPETSSLSSLAETAKLNATLSPAGQANRVIRTGLNSTRCAQAGDAVLLAALSRE